MDERRVGKMGWETDMTQAEGAAVPVEPLNQKALGTFGAAAE